MITAGNKMREQLMARQSFEDYYERIAHRENVGGS
jgi:hypothetical protein